MNRLIRLSESQGAPALPLDFPEHSLTASQNDHRNAPSYVSSALPSRSITSDVDRRCFTNNSTAFSATEVRAFYPHTDFPVAVQRVSGTITPQIAVLSSSSSIGHGVSANEPISIEGHTKATSHWFCAPCGGNATPSAFGHCLHCGLPRRSSEGNFSSSIVNSLDDSTTAATSSLVELLPEADLSAEVRIECH
jgi:ribosomal protein L37E